VSPTWVRVPPLQLIACRYINNEKPSAIFKVGQGTSPEAATSAMSTTGEYTEVEMSTEEDNVVAQLGISIEPLDQVLQQLSQKQASQALAVAPVNPSPATLPVSELAQKMVDHLFNYAS